MSTGVTIERKAADIIPEGQTLRPLRDQIVVRVIDFDYSDILIHTYRGAPVRGEVVAAGPGRYPNLYETGTKDGRSYKTMRESRRFRPTEVKVGDIVELGGLEINGYKFTQVIYNGAKCVICSEQDVAVVHEA